VIVFVFGISVFYYYCFIVPPEPVYYEYDPMAPPPRDAIYLPDGRIIVGYSYPSAVIVAPVAVTAYFFLLMITDGGRIRLREIIDLKQGWKNMKKAGKEKMREGIQEYHDWRNKKL